ncbi:hypothetical protein QTP88_025769 [Uroleucon formosanum]
MHQIKFTHTAYLKCYRTLSAIRRIVGSPTRQAELHPEGVEQSQFFYEKRSDWDQLSLMCLECQHRPVPQVPGWVTSDQLGFSSGKSLPHIHDKNELSQSIFPDIQNNYLNHEWLSQRAILATKNVDVDEINFQIQQLLPGDLMSFKSIDTVVDENESVNFPIEFLNSLDIPGMPPHNLRLKIGSPIILLRNLNPPQLCNGTRLVIKKITGNILEATILSGKFKGKVVLLPRIPMIPSDSTIPFKRLQFPIRLASAMSINKSQGQTMSICGLDLENPCFSHGQLYVACSRVGKPSNLFVLAKDRLTKNIVHRLMLN